ncbi:hypothetical protein [Streptomyces sp. SYSU K217416]
MDASTSRTSAQTDTQHCVLALDVGGTGMKGAVLDRSMRPNSVTAQGAWEPA